MTALGIFLMALPFIVSVAVMARSIGWRGTAVVIGATLGVVGSVVAGVAILVSQGVMHW